MTTLRHKALPRVAVLFADGAVGAREIADAAVGLCDLVFIVPPEVAITPMKHVLEAYGDVATARDLYARLDDRTFNRLPPIDGVITFAESLVRSTAQAATRLGLPGHDEATAEVLVSKRAQRARLSDLAVESTRSVRVRSVAEVLAELRYVGTPAIIKPNAGTASRNVYIVRAEEVPHGLAEVIAQERNMILEQYLAPRNTDGKFGSYVSVETLSVDADHRLFGITGKFAQTADFREVVDFWPSHLSRDEAVEVCELVKRSLNALQVKSGLCHTEVMLTPVGPRIIEVNGRLGGGVAELMKATFGLNIVRAALEVCLGLNPARLPCSWEADSVTYNVATLVPQGALSISSSNIRQLLRSSADVVAVAGSGLAGRPLGPRDWGATIDVITCRCESLGNLAEDARTVLGQLKYEITYEGGRV